MFKRTRTEGQRSRISLKIGPVEFDAGGPIAKMALVVIAVVITVCFFAWVRTHSWQHRVEAPPAVSEAKK